MSETWVDTVLWWQVYPLGFTGAPIRPTTAHDGVVHRLVQVESWLDHLLDLGLNGLLLGPVFASETHGYDTVDHFRIDPRLGDDEDLNRLIAACQRRGIRVVLDGVFNHVGRNHPAFRALQEQGPSAQTADLFRVRWDGWRPAERVDADVFEGHDALVTLNHESPAVEELVVSVMTYWLDRGIDGWRLDAAYAVPATFWSRVLPRVRAAHPDAWFLGEVIHGDPTRIVEETTIDSLTQYELWHGIWHAIADRNFFELTHAIKRHNRLLPAFVPQTFVGNHDVTRIATAVGADLVPHALSVLFTVAGVPSVYAGDEYGYTATKEHRLGGDDAIRPTFPQTPPAPSMLPPEQDKVHALHRDLIALRRRRPWLWRSPTDIVYNDNTTLVLRTSSGLRAVIVALNLEQTSTSAPAADAKHLLLGSATLDGSHIILPPQGWAVYSSE